MTKSKTGIALTAAMVLTCGWSGLTLAASKTISAIIPWQGARQI